MAKALLLFSEGLDSTLTGLILKREGIQVVALRFIIPFLDGSIKNLLKLLLINVRLSPLMMP